MNLIIELVLRIFDLFHKGQQERQKLIAELAAFYSEYEAALSRFYLTRQKDGNKAYSDGTMVEFITLTKLDGSIQKLHFEVRKTFNDPAIIRSFSELTRRFSLTKQMLMLSDCGYRAEAFTVALGWLNYQARKTIELTALSVGIDLTDIRHPFLIGFYPIGGAVDPRSISPNPPWEQIQMEHAIREARRMWEEAGLQWTDEMERKFRSE